MGVLITEPESTGADTTDWQELISRTTKQSKGHMAVSISNYANTSEPKIQAGSNLEVNGAYYEVNAEESITGWSGISNDTQDVYIKCVPASNSCSFAFTDTAPTWSDSKQGWYNSSDRYLDIKLSRGATSADYEDKRLWINNSIENLEIENDVTIGNDVTIEGEIFPTSSPTAGSWSIPQTTTQVVPRGIYVWIGVDARTRLEIYSGGAWRSSSSNTTGGTMLSDGTNVRINNYASAGTQTVYYLRF